MVDWNDAMIALGPHPGQEDELGVTTVLTPHHCWKDARIEELEEHSEKTVKLYQAQLDISLSLSTRIKELEGALRGIRAEAGEAECEEELTSAKMDEILLWILATSRRALAGEEAK